MTIPLNKKDILTSTYLEYIEYIKTEPDDDREIIKNTVKIFYNLDDEKFNNFTYSTILDLYKIIENILKIPQEVILTFNHNGIEYGLNPNFDDMTFGEMVDCNTDDIIKQICILYRPIIKKKGSKYIIEPYKANIEIYDELKNTLTLDIYIGFINFFLRIQQSLMNYTLNSLTELGINREQRKVLEKSGVGPLGYMNYVMGT